MAYKDKEKERRNRKEYYQKNKKRIKARMKSYGKKWYLKNRDEIRLKHKEYYRKNREKSRQYHKKWYKKNRKKLLKSSKKYYQRNIKKVQQRHRNYNRINQKKLLIYKGRWQKYRRRTNPKYRLDENIGSAIARSLKNGKNGQPWETLVDYTLKDLMKHLEKQFDNKMNWKNYGNYWAIDHIKPRSLFAYTSSKDSEFKDCWTLENLQPLENIKNIKKRNHYFI